MGLFDFLNLFKKKVPEKKPAKNSDGTYIRKIKIAGSTYDNKDGSSRQNFLKDIYNKKPPFDKQLDLMIEQFEYEGSPAYYFFVNGKCVGVVEQERANFIAKNKNRILGITDFKVDRFMPEDSKKMIYYARAKIKLYNLNAAAEQNTK